MSATKQADDGECDNQKIEKTYANVRRADGHDFKKGKYKVNSNQLISLVPNIL